MATYEPKALFDAVRGPLFSGSLTQGQVEGINAICQEWVKRHPAGDLRWLAYMLATAYHETARTMQPIREHGGPTYFRRMYDPKGERPHVAKQLGNVVEGDGALYAGRGYVQLTGRANYRKAGTIIGTDLIGSPDRALRPDLAARIMFEGMVGGWFTGKRLADYFGPGVDDPHNARRIVNGTDKAADIAVYHRAFLLGLRAAFTARPARAAPVQPTQLPPALMPAPTPPAPRPGLWARLTGLFTRAPAGRPAHLIQQEHPMDHAKSIFASKTFWANMIGLVALIVPSFGEAMTGVDTGQAADAISAAIAGLAFIVSTVFRATATKQIKA